MNEIAVLGNRVLVEKEKLDSGGIRLTPTTDADGEKNRGKILAIGQIGLRARLRGVKVGATVYFKKHFIPNHTEGQQQLVFVEIEDLLGLQN